MVKKLIHICEVCGKTEIMTPEKAFNEGWDYPPKMGVFVPLDQEHVEIVL